MRWSTERKLGTGFGLALLILSVTGGLAYWSTNRLIYTAQWVEHTHNVLRELELLWAELSSAEAGQRGFIITGNEQHLEPYYLSIADVNRRIQVITELTADNTRQQDRMRSLKPAIDRRIELLQTALVMRRQKGFNAAQSLIEQDVGRKLTRQIQSTISNMLAEENRLLAVRSQQAQVTARNTVLVVGISGVLGFGLIPIAGVLISRDITRKRKIEQALQESEQQLKSWVQALEQRNNEILQLGKLSDALQACFTLDEAYLALSALLPSLFPGTSGGVYMINESKTLLDSVAHWGDRTTLPTVFAPTECWSLRRGRSYFLEHLDQGIRCQHLQTSCSIQTLCIPMAAQGEALGIIHLSTSEPEHFTSTKQLLATTIAEQVAIAIANLKLRETLKNQSIRDSLTGLFNRRYMEESLERELLRAERNRQSLAVVMLDVDHFKRFNDSFGHDAGDSVLQAVGRTLKGMIRGSDIACRYGGEEFILILPEASVEEALQRAEQIRLAIKQLTLQHRHQCLDTITASLGIASFPQHGRSVEVITRAADAALYQAKHQGRNQVVTAQS